MPGRDQIAYLPKRDIVGANTPYPSYALLAWDTSPLKFSLPARKRKLGLAALMNHCSRFLPFTGWTPGRKLLELRARALRPKQVHFAPTLRARL